MILDIVIKVTNAKDRVYEFLEWSVSLMVMIIRGIHGILWALAAYKLSDWKNWKKYYPTILFFGMGDLTYNLAFCDKKLWKFVPGNISPVFSELFVIFVIFASTVLIFLTHYPQKLISQISYILFWIIIYTVVEIAMTAVGLQKNYNGWNIWWSIFHNSYQFPLLIVHHKNPILAWIISVIMLIIIMLKFNVPIIMH